MNSNATIDTLIQLLGLLSREISATISGGGGGKGGIFGGLKYEPPPL